MCFYVWINSCNRLDLLVNNGISLELGNMRNCVMQNTNSKMWNEKCGTTVIGPHVPIKEEDMKKNCHTWKDELSSRGKAKTCFNSISRSSLKNMILESLGKLKDADKIFKKIIFTHN